MKRLSRFFDLSILDITIKRFPLCFVFAVIMFIVAFTQTQEIIKWPNDLLGRLSLFLITGFFWSCAAKMMQESLQWSNKRYIGILTGGLIIYAVLLLIGSRENPDIILMLAHLVAANCILLCIAPFIGRNHTSESLWEFNRHLWMGVSIAFIASIIFWAGFSGVLASVGYLFDIRINSSVYATLWCFAAIILAPLYALSSVPTQFNYEVEDCALRTSLTFLVKWILLPLVGVYFLILYAYFAKILVLMEIPKGQLAWIILGFSSAGIITFLVSWPYLIQGQRVFALFKRGFFPLLILPAIMLGVSVFIRIEEYGVTPQRFYLCVITAYLMILSVVMSVGQHRLIKILILPILLIILTSSLLFNARIISQYSQLRILENSLNEYGLLKEGKIITVQNAEDIPVETRVRISSAYDYLISSYRHQNEKRHLYGYKTRDDFFKALGFEYIPFYDVKNLNNQNDQSRFNYNFSPNREYQTVISVAGYDYYVHNYYVRQINKFKERGDDGEELSIDLGLKDTILQIKINNEIIYMDLESLLADLQSTDNTIVNDKIILNGQSSSYAVDFEIRSLNGRIENGVEIPEILSGNVFIKIK